MRKNERNEMIRPTHQTGKYMRIQPLPPTEIRQREIGGGLFDPVIMELRVPHKKLAAR